MPAPAERTTVLHWFRSDLRALDNTALSAAASQAEKLALVFVFDDRLLSSDRHGAPRTRFLLDCVERLAADLAERGQQLLVRVGDPRVEIPKLAKQVRARVVTWNRDYTPFATARDAALTRELEKAGVRGLAFKDRVVFESSEVRTKQGGAFSVYTPFRNAWWRRFDEHPPEEPSPLRLPPPVEGVSAGKLPGDRRLGCAGDATGIPTGGEAAAQRRLRAFLERDVGRYAEARDFPALDATSRLSPYLRMGALSVRRCFREARDAAAAEPVLRTGVGKWLDELIWRDFYSGILQEHPRVMRGAYKPEFDALEWEDDDEGFQAWCEGRTGFPFVDAAMRQLRETGFMHNRARMVVASFLTKDLLVDWRRGEHYFMERLVDGDPASNNGGWQWAASTGTDAQPYFRIFNPTSQGERWDPDGDYVRRWVPELAGIAGKKVHTPWDAPLHSQGYSAPVVDHAERRQLALERFGAVKKR